MNTGIYKVICMFYSSSSVGECSLVYNLWPKLYLGEGYEAQGKSGVISFFINISCQSIGPYMEEIW